MTVMTPDMYAALADRLRSVRPRPSTFARRRVAGITDPDDAKDLAEDWDERYRTGDEPEPEDDA